MDVITRRGALIAIAQVAAAASLTACGMGSEDSTATGEATSVETLASVAYDLFPHESLLSETYVKVAWALLALDDPLVKDGLDQLNAMVGNKRWMDVPEPERIAALTVMEDSTFFALMRSTTVNTLYGDPDVWALVGYGGPAVTKGGYINRGFDDISWLPQGEGE